MTYPHPEVDPLDDAMTDQYTSFFGELTVSAQYVALIKGQGRVPWDDDMHQGMSKSTEVTFEITPVDPTRRLITRETLNWTPEFRRMIRPSIEALGGKIAELKGVESTSPSFNPLREINGMWVSGEFVERPDNKPGETWTTIRIDEVYPNQAVCEVAYKKYLAEQGIQSAADGLGADTEGIPFPSDEPAPVKPDDPRRANMAAFLPMLWAQAQSAASDKAGQVAELEKLVKTNPMVNQFFDMDSPEVQALIGGS